MSEKILFEYAVIRVVPKVEREEFLNVGVILYSPKLKFLQLIYTLNIDRLKAFSPSVDINELEEHLRAFEAITLGDKTAGPIARLDIASRFRWLTATRSTILQSSKVHPGFCSDPAAALTRLHATLVL
ncbi:MAG: DUF3037 domain-containing protein [Bacteroidetes bacterium]|nr:DUF3037 domain-containing protein [Bacteroidota bacterium]